MDYLMIPEIVNKRQVLKSLCSAFINCDEVEECDNCAFKDSNVDKMSKDEVNFYYQKIFSNEIQEKISEIEG